MQDELASTYAKIAIEQLLSLHALANMARASGNAEHMQAAADWLPKIEDTIHQLRWATEAKLKSGPR